MSRSVYNKYFKKYITWTEFNYNVNINLVKDYLYVETAKVACSTIKKRLYMEAMTDINTVLEKIHGEVFETPLVKPSQVKDNLFYKVLKEERYFRFTFVREPVERIVSAYIDKICRDTPHRRRFFERWAPDQDSDTIMSFDTFVSLLHEMPNIRTRDWPWPWHVQRYDKHWRPQSALIFWGEIQYDLIGCMARFEDDWKKVCAAIEYPIPDKWISHRYHETGAQDRIAELVTPAIRKKLEEIYSVDFDIYDSVS